MAALPNNRPEVFDYRMLELLQRSLAAPGTSPHEDCIERLLRFDQWDCTWPTTPPLVVIDSLTQRWRSESAARKPSGLMDWEALTDLQQTLRDRIVALTRREAESRWD